VLTFILVKSLASAERRRLLRLFEEDEREVNAAAERMQRIRASSRAGIARWLLKLMHVNLRELNHGERVALGYDLRWVVREYQPTTPVGVLGLRRRQSPLSTPELRRILSAVRTGWTRAKSAGDDNGFRKSSLGWQFQPLKLRLFSYRLSDGRLTLQAVSETSDEVAAIVLAVGLALVKAQARLCVCGCGAAVAGEKYASAQCGQRARWRSWYARKRRK
jgi:hypothetical protein